MRNFINLIFVFLFLHSCGQEIKPKNQQNTPKNLNDAILYFEKNWSNKEKKKFKEKPEAEAVLELHMSTGMWIRNNWIRGDRDTSLSNQFKAFEIFHPDDISSIILTSLHRKLNGLPIDLETQVQIYKDYWAPITDCKKKARLKAVENYNKFKIGDSINIYMPVDTSYRQRNAVLFACPDIEWEFNPQKDLLINGIITEKFNINDESNVFFKVKILKMNFDNTKILMEEVKRNDIFDFHLELLKIE